MTRYVALLRAVNVGRRRVTMATCRQVLQGAGCQDVDSFVASGNLAFSATGGADAWQRRIRAALEAEFGFELTTFVRTASRIRALAAEQPFGPVAAPHTHFVLFPLTRLTAAEHAAVQALSNEHDELVVGDREVHWLIRSRSTETTLGPKLWRDALPDTPTTARAMTMIARWAARL